MTRIRFRHPDFAEIALLFIKLRGQPEGTKKAERILNLIAEKLYYIPTTMIQPFKWSLAINDIHAAGLEGLAKAISKYDPKKNDNFFCYSYSIIRGEICREQKREMGWAETCQASSPVEEYEDSILDECDLEEELIQAQRLGILIELINNLDARSRDVLARYLGLRGECESLRHISDKLGICHETVRKIRDQAVSQLASMYATYEAAHQADNSDDGKRVQG